MKEEERRGIGFQVIFYKSSGFNDACENAICGCHR